MSPGVINHGRIVLVCGAVAILSACAHLFLMDGVRDKRREIGALHQEIQGLQEQLISAQITNSRLHQLQKIIAQNLAYSDTDTLVQGASLPFLRALTEVLDKLKITLVSLEPRPFAKGGRFAETPYRMEILCDYERFCRLINKLEQSSRLISIRNFEIENGLEDYFGENNAKPGLGRVVLELTTLTLVRD